MQTRSIIYQSKKIAYDITGRGRPVMLIHGFGEDRDVWKYQAIHLQDHNLLIIPDIPGSGGSEFNPNLETINAYAEALLAVLDAENIAVCGMIGHSMGGYICLALAEKYPERFNCLAMVHSSAFADNEEKIAARRKSIAFIEANGSLAFLKTSTPNLFSEAWKKANPSAVEGLIQRGASFLPEALIQYYNAMISRPDSIPILEKWPKPVLFLIGKYDLAIPFEASMKQCHLAAESHVFILKQSGHMGMWEERSASNAALAGFLDNLSVPL